MSNERTSYFWATKSGTLIPVPGDGHPQLSFPELAGWLQPAPGDHSVVRHAYENVLTAAARLHSFATGQLPANDGPLQQRQIMLAVDDLVSFSTNGRRLIKNTLGQRWAQNVLVPVRTDSPQTTTATINRVVNVIVHHKRLEIMRTAQDARMMAGTAVWSDLLAVNKDVIEPTCIAISEEGRLYGFSIAAVIDIFDERVLGPIVDFCDDHQLWLADD
jgi:hypothetical protein